MKTFHRNAVLLVFALFFLPIFVWADPPDPPPLPPGGHGQNGDAPMGAPIDGGLGILLALGAIYGSKKIVDLRRTTLEDNQKH